jgi:hypothetical protein
MPEVNSTNIKEIDYDEESQELTVKFRVNNRIYKYQGVTPEDYEALVNAPSLGIHLRTYIMGRFKTTEVKEK